VFVIDDDVEVRMSIQGLLKAAGLCSESFGTAEEFLRNKVPDGPSCLVLDVSLPGVDGLELQRKLADAGVRIPLCANMSETSSPSTITVGRGKKSHFDEHKQDKYFFRCQRSGRRVAGRPAVGSRF
jgi:DNA-binding NtrC family response regulator